MAQRTSSQENEMATELRIVRAEIAQLKHELGIAGVGGEMTSFGSSGTIFSLSLNAQKQPGAAPSGPSPSKTTGWTKQPTAKGTPGGFAASKTGGLAAGLKTSSFAAGLMTGGFAALLKKVTIKAEGSLGLKFEKESMVVRAVKAGTQGAVAKIEVGWEVQKVGSNTMQMTDVSKMEKADIVALIKQTGRPLSLAFKLPAKASEAAANKSVGGNSHGDKDYHQAKWFLYKLRDEALFAGGMRPVQEGFSARKGLSAKLTHEPRKNKPCELEFENPNDYLNSPFYRALMVVCKFSSLFGTLSLTNYHAHWTAKRCMDMLLQFEPYPAIMRFVASTLCRIMVSKIARFNTSGDIMKVFCFASIVARIEALLMEQIPEFGAIFVANLHFVFPFCGPRELRPNDTQLQQKLQMNLNADGSVETPKSYAGRMEAYTQAYVIYLLEKDYWVELIAGRNPRAASEYRKANMRIAGFDGMSKTAFTPEGCVPLPSFFVAARISGRNQLWTWTARVINLGVDNGRCAHPADEVTDRTGTRDWGVTPNIISTIAKYAGWSFANFQPHHALIFQKMRTLAEENGADNPRFDKTRWTNQFKNLRETLTVEFDRRSGLPRYPIYKSEGITYTPNRRMGGSSIESERYIECLDFNIGKPSAEGDTMPDVVQWVRQTCGQDWDERHFLGGKQDTPWQLLQRR